VVVVGYFCVVVCSWSAWWSVGVSVCWVGGCVCMVVGGCVCVVVSGCVCVVVAGQCMRGGLWLCLPGGQWLCRCGGPWLCLFIIVRGHICEKVHCKEVVPKLDHGNPTAISGGYTSSVSNKHRYWCESVYTHEKAHGYVSYVISGFVRFVSQNEAQYSAIGTTHELYSV